MNVNVGDTVRYLNAVGGGVVTKIKDNIAYVDDDGFETPVLIKECVVVSSPSQEKPKNDAKSQPAPAKEIPSKQNPATDEPAYVETQAGEKLNVVLAFEPTNIKKLSESTFDVYLVNDSNYYLYFSWLTRSNESDKWVARYAGIVEPGIQLLLGEISVIDLPEMDRTAVQYLAFKRDVPFNLKAPASVELSLDTTKFAKLHCFRENVYFDSPVIALDIVKNDVAGRPQFMPSSEELEQAIKQKIRKDQPVRRPILKHNRKLDELVIDLHIAELVDTTAGLSNSDMLNLQVDKFREVMDANLKNYGMKIIFIHGKGEGVLRQAIMKELKHRYKGHDVQDASFREYGFGATQVTIKQIQR
jgi:hypothetical protein